MLFIDHDDMLSNTSCESNIHMIFARYGFTIENEKIC